VKVMRPSLSPITESCDGRGQSVGEKKRILSSSWPSCCPRCISKIQTYTTTHCTSIIIQEKKPPTEKFFYSKCHLSSRVFHPTLAYGSTECSSYPASSGPKRTSRRKRVARGCKFSLTRYSLSYSTRALDPERERERRPPSQHVLRPFLP
jgi:hypothetical protein